MAKQMKRLNLALQGGGAHGAYTWGVLDRLLEEEDLEIVGISGTSAGAMNAVVLINGYMQNGYAGARDALACFWKEVSDLGEIFSPFRQSPAENFLSPWNLDWSLAYNWFDVLSRFFSPYEMNPLNLNPLRGVLENHLHLDAIRSCARIQLFIAATHVESGQPRIFKCDEITVDSILASACIPFIFQAVEIDGAPYWDGGYMGNPVLWPLFYHSPVSDVLLVQLNPLFREGTPKTAQEIINRLNEINFNSSLIAEMRAVSFVKKLIRENRVDPEKYRNVHMHLIGMPEKMRDYNASSKMNTRWDFFQHLKKLGRENADLWLKTHKHAIGDHSTVDIQKEFLTPHLSKLGHEAA